MNITSVDHTSPQSIGATAAPIPVEQAAQNREVIRAVKALNNTELLGQENEWAFEKDPKSQRMVVRIVNRKTKEVISQVPPQYVLNLAGDLRQK